MIKLTKAEKTGIFATIFGTSGVGKSASCLKYSPPPIAWICAESRAIKPTIEVSGRTLGKDLDVFRYTGFEDAIKYIGDVGTFKDYATVVFDGFSHLMAVRLVNEIIEADEGKKTIRERLKYTMPDRGLVNRATFRILELMSIYAMEGKLSIIVCLEMSYPKWDRELTGGPFLTGKEVPDAFPGYFDYIGRVFPRMDEDDNILYPPMISFQEGQGFLAKYTGTGTKRTGRIDQFFQSVFGGQCEPTEKKKRKQQDAPVGDAQ